MVITVLWAAGRVAWNVRSIHSMNGKKSKSWLNMGTEWTVKQEIGNYS